jgi:hypothetical protein
MVHGYSCGLAVVVLPEAAQPLLAAYLAAAVAGGSVGAGKPEHVPFARMIPLGVKMFYLFRQHSPQRCLPKEHQLGEAFLWFANIRFADSGLTFIRVTRDLYHPLNAVRRTKGSIKVVSFQNGHMKLGGR